MPIPNYSVLKGHPDHGEVVFNSAGKNPHYRITMNSDTGASQTDVNIESSDGSEILYVIYNPFLPPDPKGLNGLVTGITALDSSPGTLAIDYVREQVNGKSIVNRSDMSLLPIPTQNPQDQLKNAVVNLLNMTVADPNGSVFAFGSSFADPGGVTGVHNIHMNQGNPKGRFESDNGTWQDGALLIFLPSTGKWTALFIAFQSESWTTSSTGNPLA